MIIIGSPLIAGFAIRAQQISGVKLIPKRLTNVKDAYPDLSPDGKEIVFMSNRTGNLVVFESEKLLK